MGTVTDETQSRIHQKIVTERGLTAMRDSERNGGDFMTLVQQATSMMEKLPVRSQQVVVDLLKMLSGYSESSVLSNTHEPGFSLPDDFDEHFDDLNDEIATLFMGESR